MVFGEAHSCLYGFIVAKSPGYCRGHLLVVLEVVFKIDKLPCHASPPGGVCADVSEPLASLADVVLVDKPLVSLIDLPGVFKLLLGRSRYIVQYVLV